MARWSKNAYWTPDVVTRLSLTGEFPGMTIRARAWSTASAFHPKWPLTNCDHPLQDRQMTYSPTIFLLFAAATPFAAAAEWHGYEKREVIVENVSGYVVLPKVAAPGKPWLWRARFMDYHPDYAVALLAKGFHVAYYDLPNLFGSPEAMDKWDRFYDHLVNRFGLSSKMALEGVSRGGLFVYNWARRNPDKVNCIYCESPVCDMKSWPGGKGKGTGSERDWRQALQSYKLTNEQMLAFRGNPVDFAAQLGAARIPSLHIVSERDRVVPPEENTAPFSKAYRQAGGPITVHFNTAAPETANSHHFPLDDVALPVDFILRHTPGREHLAGTRLTPHGTEYFKLREGLRNSLARFTQGGEARVAFLGGSVTNMNGWRDLVCGYLRERFPQTKFDCVNAGIPSTGSTPAAFRLRRDVFGRGPVDLLFEEAAINDPANGFGARDQVRGMEGIVRQARLVNPKIDVVLLHFADPSKLEEYRAGRTPEVIRSYELVAGQYGVASIDLAREVTERIDASEFGWDQDFKNVHASPFGQSVYLRSVVRMFDAAWKDPAHPGAVAREYVLPPPIDTQSYFRGRLVDIAEARCEAPWRIEADWQPTDKIETRPGFVRVPMLVTEAAAGSCRFAFDGMAVGILLAAGPDAGIIEYSVDGQPYRRSDLYTRHSHQLHLPWTVIFDADLKPGRHAVVFRAAPGSNPRSTGHAVRIVSLLVN